MKAKYSLAMILTSALLLLPACAPAPVQAQEIHSDLPRELAPQVADADLADLVRGNNEFAFALYPQLAAGDENVFYSPYSISIALAMTYAGAKGETAAQMAQALHFLLPADRLHPAFNKLALELESRSNSEDLEPDQVFRLNVANSLWGQAGFAFEQDFLDTLAANYAAGMRLVDYEQDAEAARQKINEWVSQSTNQKIKDIIPQGALDALTRLVLANAVYFKAAWLHSFEPDSTHPGSFRLLDGTAVDVPMMHEQASLSTTTGDGYRAIELPYAGWQLSMLILLPDEGEFGDVEARLNAEFLEGTLAAMKWGQVVLTLPKYKYEWSLSMADGLEALGMRDAFDPQAADLSGMDGRRDLYVTDVLHKAFVAVDEAGTEAAAATTVIVGATSMPADPIEFKIDRPFFFLIRDNPTGTILFMGRVMNPS
ncbi:MAG: serpin family protein [Anaerolineales bacterium]|nr:serpin family protein [Anaerolineales bacterium]